MTSFIERRIDSVFDDVIREFHPIHPVFDRVISKFHPIDQVFNPIPQGGGAKLPTHVVFAG